MTVLAVSGAIVMAAIALANPPSSRQLSDALPELERAYRRQPENYANGWNLALAYYQLGRLTDSKAHLDRLLKQSPTAEAHNLLGAVLERMGDHQQAARNLEAAVRLEPSEKNIGDLGGFLVRRAALDSAIQVYTYGLKSHPRSQALHIGLGLAYHGRRDYDNAVKWVCAAVDLNPSDPRPILFLGKLVDTSERFAPELTERLANFARLYPENAQARFYYALSLLKQAEKGSAPFEQALIEEHLQAAARLDPSSFETQLQLGRFYEVVHRDHDAIRALGNAVRLQPQSEAAHYRLARAYQRIGNSALAKKEFEIVRQLRASDKSRARQ